MSQPHTFDHPQRTPAAPQREHTAAPGSGADPIRDIVLPRPRTRRAWPAAPLSPAPSQARAGVAAPRPVAGLPAGIVLISSMQFLMAGLVVVVVLLLSPVRIGVSGRMAERLVTAWPALLMMTAGTGMLLRWTWGWRLTTAIAWFLLGNPVCEFVLGLMRGQLAVTAPGVALFLVALGAVAYLNSTKQMSVFGIGDPESSGRNRPLPAMAGLCAAAIRTLASALA